MNEYQRKSFYYTNNKTNEFTSENIDYDNKYILTLDKSQETDTKKLKRKRLKRQKNLSKGS